MKRLRHFETVLAEYRSSSATVLLSSPSAHLNTIYERSTNA